ncbi:metalloregulator ArsR/SmtB family transcription factor [Arenibacter sp. GZD96]|uniref:ArsR/SmtB family transcription factor n=1 Tax=Aurantibrevibacter litoralis TaxID=3106030 RepID=UPI002AFFED59|nr:metalloregulator ArsR/SmtB family transcription factor [Arenibacter sp. GZD-96]MEA1785756.1 metalloregulator ArsR/SmtB family transcription factor [Arenibacter sp. GZD-96]
MGASKTHIFNTSQNTLASLAKVLGHPARIAIIQYISKNKDAMCNDLVDVIGLSQPTITQHMNTIKKAGLLKVSFKGKYPCYRMHQEKWQELQLPFQDFFKRINTTIHPNEPQKK